MNLRLTYILEMFGYPCLAPLLPGRKLKVRPDTAGESGLWMGEISPLLSEADAFPFRVACAEYTP